MSDLDEELVARANGGDLEGVKRALERGANVHAYTDRALRYASENEHVDIVKLLLERGADVHAYSDWALRYASENGHVGIVKLLLGAGSNVHFRDDEALYLASMNCHVAVVIQLVEAGADLRVLRKYWVRLFGCRAPSGLVKMKVKKVVDLVLSEAVARELA